jgi:hypothetical protein
MYQFPYGQPSMVSYYVQQQPPPGPFLMSPPPFSAYQYGGGPACFSPPLAPPQPRLHRAGSINAKIYSSEARY